MHVVPRNNEFAKSKAFLQIVSLKTFENNLKVVACVLLFIWAVDSWPKSQSLNKQTKIYLSLAVGICPLKRI